jgi:hypothetical protein
MTSIGTELRRVNNALIGYPIFPSPTFSDIPLKWQPLQAVRSNTKIAPINIHWWRRSNLRIKTSLTASLSSKAATQAGDDNGAVTQ